MKKFLDSSGVTQLWGKLIEQSEQLVHVINIIDEEKADRIDLDKYLLKEDYTGSETLSSEEWTFTLVDGAVVTKKVAIK